MRSQVKEEVHEKKKKTFGLDEGFWIEAIDGPYMKD